MLGLKSKGLLEESIRTLATSDIIFTPRYYYIYNTKTAGKFEGSCLKEDNFLLMQM